MVRKEPKRSTALQHQMERWKALEKRTNRLLLWVRIVRSTRKDPGRDFRLFAPIVAECVMDVFATFGGIGRENVILLGRSIDRRSREKKHYATGLCPECNLRDYQLLTGLCGRCAQNTKMRKHGES